jgi:hypothetical protein
MLMSHVATRQGADRNIQPPDDPRVVRSQIKQQCANPQRSPRVTQDDYAKRSGRNGGKAGSSYFNIISTFT